MASWLPSITDASSTLGIPENALIYVEMQGAKSIYLFIEYKNYIKQASLFFQWS